MMTEDPYEQHVFWCRSYGKEFSPMMSCCRGSTGELKFLMQQGYKGHDQELFDALWQVAYFGSMTVRLSVGGGHDTYYIIDAGDWTFKGSMETLKKEFIPWAEKVRNRGANQPIPPP